MIVLETPLDYNDIVSMIPEAQTQFDALSKTFDKAEISTIVENLSKGEPHLAIALGSLNENIQLQEFMVKHVSSKGEVTKTKDRKTRSQQAFQTTGLSKSKRRQIARKAAKTKRANPTIQIKAQKKTKKALKRRKSLGLNITKD